MFKIGPPDSLHTFHRRLQRNTRKPSKRNDCWKKRESDDKLEQSKGVCCFSDTVTSLRWHFCQPARSPVSSHFFCWWSRPRLSSPPHPLVYARKEVWLVLGNLLSTTSLLWTGFLPPPPPSHPALETRVKVGNDVRASVAHLVKPKQ